MAEEHAHQPFSPSAPQPHSPSARTPQHSALSSTTQALRPSALGRAAAVLVASAVLLLGVAVLSRSVSSRSALSPSALSAAAGGPSTLSHSALLKQALGGSNAEELRPESLRAVTLKEIEKKIQKAKADNQPKLAAWLKGAVERVVSEDLVKDFDTALAHSAPTHHRNETEGGNYLLKMGLVQSHHHPPSSSFAQPLSTKEREARASLLASQPLNSQPVEAQPLSVRPKVLRPEDAFLIQKAVGHTATKQSKMKASATQRLQNIGAVYPQRISPLASQPLVPPQEDEGLPQGKMPGTAVYQTRAAVASSLARVFKQAREAELMFAQVKTATANVDEAVEKLEGLLSQMPSTKEGEAEQLRDLGAANLLEGEERDSGDLSSQLERLAARVKPQSLSLSAHPIPPGAQEGAGYQADELNLWGLHANH